MIRAKIILWILGFVAVVAVLEVSYAALHYNAPASAVSTATDAPATDAPTDPPTATPARSPDDRKKALAYWGSVIDVYSDALSDGVSAYDDGNDRETAANYFENCATNADSAKSRADYSVPDGWGDVQAAVDDGMSDLKTRCTQDKLDLYGGGTKGGVHDAAKAPPRILEALHMARVHMSAGGGNPSALRRLEPSNFHGLAVAFTLCFAVARSMPATSVSLLTKNDFRNHQAEFLTREKADSIIISHQRLDIQAALGAT